VSVTHTSLLITRDDQATATQGGKLWPLGIVGLVLGSLLLWLPALGLPLHYDAMVYATAAHWWAQGDTLYAGFTITRPQGIFVIFRAIEAVGLGSSRGIQFVGALCSAASAALLLLIVSRVWGRAIGYGSAILFAAIMATPALEGTTTNAELFMLVPLLGGLYLLLCADDTALGGGRNLLLVAGCGLCFSLALQLKPAAVTMLPLAALWLLRGRYSGRYSWGALVRAELILAVSFLLGLAPALIHGLLTAPDIYLYAILFYRLNKTVAGDPLSSQLARFAARAFLVVLSLPLLLLVPKGLRAAWRAPDTRGRDLLVLWLGASLVGAAMGGYWWLHYYQQLLPPLLVAVALGWRAIWRGGQRGLPATVQRCIAVLGGVCLAITVLFAVTVRAEPLQLLAGVQPYYRPAEPVAAYLREHTAADEGIFIVYERPEIYYLAQRRPVTSWPNVPDLVRVPGAFERQIALLADPATAPRYIAAVQPFDEGGLDAQGTLRALMERDYVLETTVEGIPIYRRR